MSDEPQIEEIPTDSEPVQEVKGSKAGSPIIPLIAILILMPVVTISLFEFVIMPRMLDKFSAVASGLEDPEEGGDDSYSGDAHGGGDDHGGGKDSHGKKGHGGKGGGGNITFDGIVANVRGTVGSRYIKVSFIVEGRNKNFAGIVEKNRPRLRDATLGVLQELTLQNLDEPGIKNVVRSDLLSAFDTVLHGKVVERLYFTDFVVQ